MSRTVPPHVLVMESSFPKPSHRVLTSFWTFHVLGWLAIGLSMWFGVVAHVDDPYITLLAKMWFGMSGGLVALGLRPFYQYLYERTIPIPALISIAAVVSYVATVIWSGLFKIGARVIRASIAGQDFYLPSFASIFSGALFYTFIMLAWSVLYFGIKYYRDMEAERERAIRAEGHAHRAELQALRYQLNPHFLFNTMNAISTLVAEGRSSDAERMIARLSDFLRLTLENDAAPEAPLVEEIDFTRRYLEIEQIRFGDRLSTTIDVDADTMSACVPTLLLQPLVENAIRHGIAANEEGGTVRVSARRAGQRLLLRVEDDGRGFNESMKLKEGIGLSNTRARLDALYHGNHRFEIAPSDGGGCIVSIDIPLRTETAPVASPLHTDQTSTRNPPTLT
ncbi:sensor histidine kinase [Longibacter salinarum]|nr:histidine kinase [Longibacter salinarum]